MANESRVTVSVIVAAFNEEDNITRCVDSIESQSFKDIEIIVVNDGSTDGTESILKSLAGVYPNLRFYTQENQGVSVARNQGLSLSNAKYVLFVDADDFLKPGAVESMVKQMERTGASLVQGLLRNGDVDSDAEQGNTQIILLPAKDLKSVALNRGKENSLSRDVKESTHGCYGKLYRMDVIEDNDLEFEPGLGLGEDLLFYIDYLNYSNSVCVLLSDVYCIRANIKSSTRRFNPKMMDYSEIAIRRISDLYSNPDFDGIDISRSILSHLDVCVQSCFIKDESSTNSKELGARFAQWLNRNSELSRDVAQAATLILNNRKQLSMKDKVYLPMLKNRKFEQFIRTKIMIDRLKNVRGGYTHKLVYHTSYPTIFVPLSSYDWEVAA